MGSLPSRRLLFLFAALSTWPSAIVAQLISLKTVPVAAGDQFLVFPSDNLAFGGVSVALDDAVLDPFVNPAMGARAGEPHVFSAPTFYSVSNRAGSARTLPVGGRFGSNGWFGGVFAALQNLKRGEEFFFGPLPLVEPTIAPNGLSSQSATNKYAHLNIGKAIGNGLAVGASAYLADLGAIDGVEHLYASASGVAQNGSMVDLRLGLSKQFEGDRRFEATVLHHRFAMRHDVVYVEWVIIDSTNWVWEPRSRLEMNEDDSRTWGAQVSYHQPVGTTGWRVGGTLTANRKSHPKIPNYELMNIPRDPGHSNAFDIGLGIAKVTKQTTFGLDVIYEPATSETWAEAAVPTEKSSGDTIPAGGKTVENSFSFSNAFVRMGVSHDLGPVSFQLGVNVRAYEFHLDQWNNVEDSFRRQDESWMEWVPSWGVRVPLSDFELRYLGRVTTGTGRPGVAWTGAAANRALAAAEANDILLAPTGPLTLQDATVMTHQVSISIPIR